MSERKRPETVRRTEQNNLREIEALEAEVAHGPLAPGQRWTAARKREVALRLLRGVSLEALSRELGVKPY